MSAKAVYDLCGDRGSYFGWILRDIVDIIAGFLRWDGAPIGVLYSKPLPVDKFGIVDYHANLILYLASDRKMRIHDLITGGEWNVRDEARMIISRDEYYAYYPIAFRRYHLAYNIHNGAKRIIEEKTGLVPDKHIRINGWYYHAGILYTDRDDNWNCFVGGHIATYGWAGPPNIHPDVVRRAKKLSPECSDLYQFHHTADMCTDSRRRILVQRWGDNIECDAIVEHPRGALMQCGRNVIFVESAEPNKRTELFQLGEGTHILYLYGNILITMNPSGLSATYLTS